MSLKLQEHDLTRKKLNARITGTMTIERSDFMLKGVFVFFLLGLFFAQFARGWNAIFTLFNSLLVWFVLWISHRRIFGLNLELFDQEKMCVLRDSLWSGERRHVVSHLRVAMYDQVGGDYGITSMKCLVSGKRKYVEFYYFDILRWLRGSPVSILSTTGLTRRDEKKYDRRGIKYSEGGRERADREKKEEENRRTQKKNSLLTFGTTIIHF